MSCGRIQIRNIITRKNPQSVVMRERTRLKVEAVELDVNVIVQSSIKCDGAHQIVGVVGIRSAIIGELILAARQCNWDGVGVGAVGKVKIAHKARRTLNGCVGERVGRFRIGLYIWVDDI